MKSARYLILMGVLGCFAASFSCAPLVQPRQAAGLTPTQAREIAMGAVRTAQRDQKLELQAVDVLPVREGEGYSVYLQEKTSAVTAHHWRVLVHGDRSAEVVPADPAPTTPETLRAHPAALEPPQNR